MSFRKHQVFRLFRKGKSTRNNLGCLKEDKKLHLVLDLDHTLVHSILVSQLSRKEKYLIGEADSRADLYIWRFDEGHMHPTDLFIKLRPFVREFLQEASKLFSMHVYTMGSSSYAQTVLALIDPKKDYFGDRVITREESPLKKTLDLLAADKRRVVIVDDTSAVWPDHKRNLLEITKYMYFRDEYNSISYAEDRTDESRSNGALANVLKLLKNAHKRFQDEFDSKDLRLLIRDPPRPCCCFF